MKKCQECKIEIALYQCPGCYRRTCSLRCCKLHKVRLGCNGKRNRTTFKRLEDMNDITLRSDFHFLEDVLCTIDGGKRLFKNVGSGGSQHLSEIIQKEDNNNNNNKEKIQEKEKEDESIDKKKNGRSMMLSPKWKRLIQEAKGRGITVLLMPSGMSRHKSNTSQYNVANDIIFWRVEFILHTYYDTTNEKSSKSSVVTLRKISEQTKWIEEWERMQQQQPKNDQSDKLHFLMKRLPCPSNKPMYVRIDKEMTLRQVLKNMTIVEFPTIEVVMDKDLNKFPLAIEEI